MHYCPPHNNGCHPRGRRRGRNPPCLTTSLLASPVGEKLIEKVLQRLAELKWLKRNLGEKGAVVILPDSEGDEAELNVFRTVWRSRKPAFILQIKQLKISVVTKTAFCCHRLITSALKRVCGRFHTEDMNPETGRSETG